MPFVKYRRIIDRILEENGGYTLESDITADFEYTHACLPLSRLKPYASSTDIKGKHMRTTERLLADRDAQPGLSFEGIDVYTFNFANIATNTNDSQLYYYQSGIPSSFGAITTIAFKAPRKGTYIFKTSFYIQSRNWRFQPAISWYRISTTGTITRIGKKREDEHVSGILFENNPPVTLAQGESVAFAVEANWIQKNVYQEPASPGIWIDDFRVEATEFIGPGSIEPELGQDVSIKGNLPDITQSDFIREFMRIYGLTFDIDNHRRVIRMYTFDRIMGNKTIARDWSHKYQRNTGRHRFTIGSYAMRNYLRFKTQENSPENNEEDEAISNAFTAITEGMAQYFYDKGHSVFYKQGETIREIGEHFEPDCERYYVISMYFDNFDLEDRGLITAYDENLKEEANLFELSFEAVENNSHWNVPKDGSLSYRVPYAKIPRYTPPRDDDEGSFEYDKAPKLLLYGDDSNNVLCNDNEYNLCYVASIVNGHSVQAQALVNKYYPSLQIILNDMRFIEDAEFYLTPQDIEEYDPFVPVYIDYFGAYFYINQIKNFVSGNLTKCDLVRI
jgi:hypothetical protein